MKINPKKWVQEHRGLFDTVVGRQCRIAIDNIVLDESAFCNAVMHTVLDTVENQPEKRPGDDGKQYTPPCFTLQFENGQGELIFAIEDTSITANIRSGITLRCGDTRVEVNPI